MRNSAETVLEVEGLSKSFNGKSAVKNVSFTIKKNSIVGLVGKNGAGKTTLMRMLIGFLKPDSGSIKVFDENIIFGSSNLRVGYLTDVPVFYDYMSSYEYLIFCANLRNINTKKDDSVVKELLKLVDLEDSGNKRIKGYSRGMKQRLGIAQCMLGTPDLIICDEPMSALDPAGREEVIKLFNKIKKNTSILISTHILTDIERLCEEVVIMDMGIAKTINSLKELSSNNKVMEVNIIKQETEFINKFKSLLKHNNIKYIINDGMFLLSELDERMICIVYNFFGNDNNIGTYPESIRMVDVSFNDILR